MTVATAALLEADMGGRLPSPVRQTLIGIGVHCNDTVLALNSAESAVLRAQAARAAFDSGPAAFPWQAQAINQWVTAAEAYRDRLAVALAHCVVPYAVFVSRVASDVVAGRTPAMPAVGEVLPSQLIADGARLLPVITFQDEREAVTVQNAEVAAVRVDLFDIIDDERRANSASRYDDPLAAKRLAKDFPGDLAEFPAALLTYASTLAWAVGVYTKTGNPAVD
ncbi:hypothetical protein [Winogradskya humida]|uniref:Uncharacterized protein n=1 Tax=Winogradskya humida TaxID=113566 RepID=A0ABQ4A244_9ACTN|nr:hypothetical protein [Actinoplanes humidus]GIE24897.1 hypothetical protein Ahu01nite_079990 [Actinoplanes humidus]